MTIAPKAGIDPADISGALRGFTTATTGITAAVASNQAGGTPIRSAFNRVTTVANAGDSVTLPVALAGASLVITNASATSMDVFPAVGGVINALSPNAAFAIAGGVTVMFVCSVAGTWNTITGP
jgi:hypothetical protein